MNEILVGINIQYPISRAILDGTKTIETRTYPLPKKYIGKSLAIVETPGKSKNFKARVVGIIKFGESFQYSSKKAFYKDTNLHLVTPDSPWKWKKTKWGWPILKIETEILETNAPKRKGIIFTKDILVRRTAKIKSSR